MRAPSPSFRLATVVAIGLATSCVTPGGAPRGSSCSLPDASAWREYRSAHFVLWTDVPRSRAAALVEQLEQLHARLLVAMFGEPVEVLGRAQVVAFASRRRLADFAPEHVAGYLTVDLLANPTIVLAFDGREPAAEVVAHELAHQISWHHFTRQPPWFREGLAMFFQSVGVRRDDEPAGTGSRAEGGERRSGGYWAGFASPAILLAVRNTTRVAVAELLGWRGRLDLVEPARFHAGSFLLYHFLWNERSKAFAAFEDRLAAGDDPDAAWRASFPEYDRADRKAMKRLDDELEDYRRHARYVPYRVDARAADTSFVEGPVSTADLHVLLLGIPQYGNAWVDVASESAHRRRRTRAQVEEALREDPLQPLALALRVRAERRSIEAPDAPATDAILRERELAALRPVTAARPDDWRAWTLLADVERDVREQEAAYRKVLAVRPDDWSANNSLAWILVTSGRAREARPLAERAVNLAPWKPASIDTLAAVALAIGQCEQALALQRRAVDYYAPDDPRGEELRAHLAEFQAKCGASPAPRSAAPLP